MLSKRTPAWWWVRLELLAGLALTVRIAWLGLDSAGTVTIGNAYRITLGPLEMSASFLAPITALVMALVFAVVGLIWMVRIFRGPRDEPPPWRYRDH